MPPGSPHRLALPFGGGRRGIHVKRFVLMLAVVALVAAMSPITAAHAASPVNVRVINAEAVSIDLWQDGVQIVTNLARGAGIDVASTGGGHQYIVCTAGSQATPVFGVSCNDGPPSTLPLAAGPIDFVSGSNNTFVVGPGPNGIGFTNSLSIDNTHVHVVGRVSSSNRRHRGDQRHNRQHQDKSLHKYSSPPAPR